MKKIFIIIGLGCMHSILHAQVLPPVNCTEAISICDSIETQDTLKVALNFSSNEISNNSCLPHGEIRGTWYKFGVNTPGNLRFTITPLDTNVDFDWALFRTDWASCTDIFGVPSYEISCNASGIGGGNYTTGASGLIQQGHNPAINLTTPALFYLYITTSMQDTDAVLGYVIDFSASDMNLVNCNEIGIEENPYQPLHIFPNPADEVVFVSPPTGIFIPMGYAIFDLTGKQVAYNPCWNQANGMQVAHLEAGVYYYQIYTQDKKQYTGKVLVK
jgi:hypothetical protein